MKSVKYWIDEWNETKRFLNIPVEKRNLVFYSEGPGTTSHLRPIIESITKEFKLQMFFISSDKKDILFENSNPYIESFFIGNGSARTFIFPRIESKVLITTTPSIQSKQLKKSKNTHYIYTNHSPVSTHMVYQENAFDNFDSFFCCGPHQFEEIKKRETLYNLKPKNLLKTGLPKLDMLLKIPRKKTTSKKPMILIAPSWGSSNIIKDCAEKLISTLLKGNFQVTLRPHNMTWRNKLSEIQSIKKRFISYSNFSIDEKIDSIESILQSDFLITDWSGIAMEYGFGLNKPILFINLPPKINNPNFNNLKLTPLEDSIRTELGEIIQLENLNDLSFIQKQMRSAQEKTFNQNSLGNKWIYNLGESGKKAAEQIYNILHSLD